MVLQSLLLSDCHFGMSYHLVVEHVSCLDTVDDLTLLVVSHTWHHSDSFVVVDVEVLSIGLDFLDA